MSLKVFWDNTVFVKGELKAEINNFPKNSFEKPSISKVRFVELFPPVSFFFLRENYVRSWAFPTFAAFLLPAQKLNQ